LIRPSVPAQKRKASVFECPAQAVECFSRRSDLD
jgi:hypothetical protein